MTGLASFASAVQALGLVGVVLVEAVVLYVGYGALTRVLGPIVRRTLTES